MDLVEGIERLDGDRPAPLPPQERHALLHMMAAVTATIMTASSRP